MAIAKAALPILFDAASGAKGALSLLRQQGPRAVIEKYGRKFYDELQQVDDRLRADLDLKLKIKEPEIMSPALREKGLGTKKIKARDKRIEQEAGKRFDPDTGGYEMLDEVPLQFQAGGIASAIMDIQNRKEGSGPMGEGLLELLREQLRKDDERLNVRDFTDVIFDPQDPVDLGIAGVAATGVGLPAAATAKIANSGRKIVRGIGSLLPEANDKAIKNYFKYYLGRELAEAPGLIKEEVQNMADGGVPIRGYAIGGIAKAVKNLLKKNKKKDAPKKDIKDGVDEGSGTGDLSANQKSFIQKNPVKTILGGGAFTEYTGLTNLTRFGPDPETEEIVFNNQSGSLNNNNLRNLNSEPEDLSGVPGETLGLYARKILQQKGFEFDEATGKFKDGSKPKFLDYLKAFGSGYMEKTAEDPDFAKKMMAGFAAMTMPKEGPVGFSPLGISEFTQGYLGADQALAEGKPATVQLLDYLKANPDQVPVYEKLLQSESGSTNINIAQAAEQVDAVQDLYFKVLADTASRAPSFTGGYDDLQNYDLYTEDGQLIDTTNLLIKLQENANLLQNLSLRKK